jgi:two-component system KDP operon response regulator KdpE
MAEYPSAPIRPLLLADQAIHAVVEMVLRRDGVAPATTLDHPAAVLAYPWSGPVDLAVIESRQPHTQARALCAKLQQFFQFPILIVAEGVVEQQRIELLDAGADDVISLPAGLAELPARCRMLVRRRRRQLARDPASAYICLGDLRLDILGRRLLLPQGRGVDLTPDQTRLLALLLSLRGACAAPTLVSEHLFGSQSAMPQRLATLLSGLNRRLQAHPDAPQVNYLRRYGYRVVMPPAAG